MHKISVDGRLLSQVVVKSHLRPSETK